MIKELILEANELVDRECHIVFNEMEKSCELCNYNTRMNSKRICVIIEEMADKYKYDKS